jgi:hypothetical protein
VAPYARATGDHRGSLSRSPNLARPIGGEQFENLEDPRIRLILAVVVRNVLNGAKQLNRWNDWNWLRYSIELHALSDDVCSSVFDQKMNVIGCHNVIEHTKSKRLSAALRIPRAFSDSILLNEAFHASLR